MKEKTGDGGNREGQYDYWYPGLDSAPQPAWTAFRQPQFGHGKLVVQNATHSLWTWHRTELGEKVVSDEAWIKRADAAAARSGSVVAEPAATGLGLEQGASNFERGQQAAAVAGAAVPTAKGLRSE